MCTKAHRSTNNTTLQSNCTTRFANSRPVCYRTINQYGGTIATREIICFHYRALYGAYALNTFHCRGALDIRVNRDTTRCVWTGEFDLNTLHVDGEIYKSGKKKLRIQKSLDTVWTGPKFCVFWRTRRSAATFSY